MCQAISDSYLGDNKEKLAVARWVKSDDFSYVCDMANFNAENLQKKMQEILVSKPVVARYIGERLKKAIQSRAFNM